MSLLLFIAAAELVTGTWSLPPLLTRPQDVYGNYAVHMAAGTAIPFLYLLFQGRAFDSAITRRLRGPVLERALFAGAFTAPVVLLLLLPQILPPGDYRIVLPQPENTAFAVWGILIASSFALTLMIAVHAYMTAADKEARRRLRAYVFAFGVLDVAFIMNYSTFVVYVAGYPVGTTLFEVNAWTYPTAPFVFALILTYVILKTQLFDIDLRLKWTIKQSTVAAAFVAVFFVVSELAQEFFQPSLGAVAGILAAGALVFLLAPLQRAADRVANVAIPKASATEEYLTFRKLEVYKAALEEAQADGTVTDKDRRILAALRAHLGISDETAALMERGAA